MAKQPPPPASQVREELERVLDSEALRRAPSHARLLRYLVEKQLANNGSALRETSIALEVFRRDPVTYDPRSDPIVRVTAGRLRDRLDVHYAQFGTPPKLRITLPKGRYVPEFIADSADTTAVGLAVMRTRNNTGDARLQARCDAFAESLTDHLSHAGLPRVIARGSVDSAEARSTDPAEIGTHLDVPWVIDSTLTRENERELRLSVRLVYAADASVRWVETGIGPLVNLHLLTDRMLSSTVVRTVETLPGPSALAAHLLKSSSLPERERAALDQARLSLLQRSLESTEAALSLIEPVTRAFPSSADAWAALAAAQYSRLSFMDQPLPPLIERVRESVDRALALDAEQPVALRTRAILTCKCEFRIDEAEALFARVLRTMPHYTSARLNYAELLTIDGRFEDALAQLNLARVYDPLSLSVHLARAHCLTSQRRYAEARAAWALCRAGGEASLWVLTGSGQNELADGQLDAAQRFFNEAAERFPDLPFVLLCLGWLEAARGNAARARAIERDCIDRFAPVSKVDRAILAGLLRDRDAAIALFGEAIAERDMDALPATRHPAFDWLAEDEVFQSLLERCGLNGRLNPGRMASRMSA